MLHQLLGLCKMIYVVQWMMLKYVFYDSEVPKVVFDNYCGRKYCLTFYMLLLKYKLLLIYIKYSFYKKYLKFKIFTLF